MPVPPGADRERLRLQADRARGRPRRRPPRSAGDRRRPGRAGWWPRPASTRRTSRQDALVLLPEDGDASARALRARLRRAAGRRRRGRGQRHLRPDLARGAHRRRGRRRRHPGADRPPRRGRRLRQPAGDDPRRRSSTSWPSAADLVKGKLAGVPVAVIRGLAPRAARARHGHPPAGAAARRRPLPLRRPRPGRLPRRPAPTWCRAPASSPRSPRRSGSPAPRSRSSPWCCATAARSDGVVDVHLTDAVTHHDGGQPRRAARRGDRPAARRGLDHPLGAGRRPPAAPRSSAGSGSGTPPRLTRAAFD